MDIKDSFATPEISEPLSPVLTNSHKERKKIKSRIKLMNRFSQSTIGSRSPSPNTQNVTLTIQDNNNMNNNESKSDNEIHLVEIMRKINEVKNMKKVYYDVSDDTQQENQEDLQINILNAISTTKSININENKTDTNFKTEINENENQKNNESTVIARKDFKGFATGSGRSIVLSEKAINRATKIFDDIFDVQESNEKLTNISEKNTKVEFQISSFEDKLESYIQQNFTQIIRENENHVKNNTNFEDNSQNIQDLTLIRQDFETNPSFSQESTKFSPYTPEETSNFKIPTIQKKITLKNISPKICEQTLTQLTDTQMCDAIDNAECLAGFSFSQWNTSPDKIIKIETKKLENDILNKNNEEKFNFEGFKLDEELKYSDFFKKYLETSISYQKKNVLYPLTSIYYDVKDIIDKKNKYDFRNKRKLSQESSQKVKRRKKSIPKAVKSKFNDLGNILQISTQNVSTDLDETVNEEILKSEIPLTNDFDFKKNSLNSSLSDIQTSVVANLEDIASKNNFGFSTAAGNKIQISEKSLKKAQTLFTDIESDVNNISDNPKNNNIGFSTPTGNKVKISEEGLERERTIFNDIENVENKLCETPKSNKFGFQTASGNKVKISQDGLKKAQSLFNDIENVENNLCVTPKNYNFGFQTASGNKVKISKNSLIKAQTIFNDIENLENNLCETPKNDNFGYPTVSDKISEKSLKKAQTLFIDIENDENILCETPKNMNFGFNTASGKKIKISEEKLNSAKNIFKDIELDSTSNTENNSTLTKAKENFGLSTVSGKVLECSEEKLSSAKNIFKDIDTEKNNSLTPTNNLDSKNVNKNINIGFSTASGKKVSISEDNLQKAKKIFSNLEDETISNNTPKMENVGFSTASGKKVDISTENLNKGKEIFAKLQEENNLLNFDTPKLNKIRTENLQKNIFDQPSTSGFSCASGKKLKISEESLNRAKNIFKDIDENNMETNKETKNILQEKSLTSNKLIPTDYKSPLIQNLRSPQRNSNNTTPILRNKNITSTAKKRSLGLSSCKQLDVPENSLKRARLIFEDLETPKKELNTTTQIKITPKIEFPKKIAPSSQKHISPPQKNSNVTLNTSISSVNSYLSFKDTAQDVPTFRKKMHQEYSKVKLHISVLETRMKFFEEQQNILASNDKERTRPKPGHLFSRKTDPKNIRITLKNAVNNVRPGKILKIKIHQQLSTNIFDINSENATKLNFYVPWFKNENKTYPSILKTEDSAIIVPNSDNFIGLFEIEQSFKSMEGVDPELIPEKWIENHYKWVVWKLASMERSYQDIFDNYLTAENVISQLKYRYDREIDKAQRSALKKIVELDDIAAKRIVLCVSNIFNLPDGKNELELSDGWYGIKTCIDIALNTLVDRGIIKIGTKLMIFGAQLLNCQGCSPLEMPSNVRLQISYNSTRRAAWYVKLGYQPVQTPLNISLRSIHHNGGSIGSVKVYIARIYPLSFMERLEMGVVWRNDRSETRRSQEWEAARLSLVERIQGEIETELQKEWVKKGGRRSGRVKRKEVEGVTCPQTLYEMMESCADPDSLKEMMSPSQCSSVRDYQEKLCMKRQSEMSHRLQKRLSEKNSQKRNVSPVLKLLLIDVSSTYHYRNFSIWYPKEAYLTELKEGIVINLYNIVPRNNGSLSSTSKMHVEIDKKYNLDKFDLIRRCVTPIEKTLDTCFKPLFHEFDTVGIIIYIEIQTESQNIWLCDEKSRYLSIHIGIGPQNCNLLEGFKVGEIVAIMNLQHRQPNKEFGKALGNLNTLITRKPQKIHLQNYLHVFKLELPKDLNSYIEQRKNDVEVLLAHTLLQFNDLQPFEYSKDNSVNSNTKSSDSIEMTVSDEEMFLIDTSIM